MAPLLLVELVAGMHQLDLGTGRALLRAVKTVRGLQAPQALPQIIAQVAGIVDQRRFHRDRRHTALHGDDQFLGLAKRGLRESAAIVARVLVKGHVEPALRLRQMIITHRPPGVVQRLDAPLHPLVAVEIGVNGLVADALLGCVESHLLGVGHQAETRQQHASGEQQ